MPLAVGVTEREVTVIGSNSAELDGPNCTMAEEDPTLGEVAEVGDGVATSALRPFSPLTPRLRRFVEVSIGFVELPV